MNAMLNAGKAETQTAVGTAQSYIGSKILGGAGLFIRKPRHRYISMKIKMAAVWVANHVPSPPLSAAEARGSEQGDDLGWGHLV